MSDLETFASTLGTPCVTHLLYHLETWQINCGFLFFFASRNVGWRWMSFGGGGAEGQGCWTSTKHHTHPARSSLSTCLLSTPLRTCFQGPRFLTGCLVWVTGCRLPVYWEGDWQRSEGQTPCRMWGGGGKGGAGVLHKHIMWNAEAHSIVPCAISAVCCYEICFNKISAGAALGFGLLLVNPTKT